MAPKRRLSYEERVKIQVLMDEGYSLTAIADKVKCSRSCVSKTLLRMKETGTLKDRKSSGRPQISSSRALAWISIQNRRLTSTHLKREWQDTSGVCSSARTVKRRLDETGLHGRVARKKPLLTEQHKRVWLAWAKERKDWTLHEWQSIIWSHESIINLFGMMGENLCEEELEKTYCQNVFSKPWNLEGKYNGEGMYFLWWNWSDGRKNEWQRLH